MRCWLATLITKKRKKFWIFSITVAVKGANMIGLTGHHHSLKINLRLTMTMPVLPVDVH